MAISLKAEEETRDAKAANTQLRNFAHLQELRVRLHDLKFRRKIDSCVYTPPPQMSARFWIKSFDLNFDFIKFKFKFTLKKY